MALSSVEKLTALSTSCNTNAIDMLSGERGILSTHKLFEGIGKSQFIKLAICHTLKHPPTKDQMLQLLKFSKNADSFDLFLSSVKGGNHK